MFRFLSSTLTDTARAGLLVLAMIVCVLALVGKAGAQEPTDDQKNAIKANCRSDFLSLCSGVPRGGAEALQCLKKNVANLSVGCQQAVKAIAPAPPPPAKTTAPAAPPPPAPPTPAAATPAAPAPAATTTAAPSAAGTPPPPAAPTAVETPATAAPSPAAAPANPAATPAAPAPAAKSAATPLLPPPTPPVAPAAPPSVRVVRPVQVLMLVRNSCRAEYRAYCSNVDIGGGRVVACLQSNAASLSPTCQSGLAELGR